MKITMQSAADVRHVAIGQVVVIEHGLVLRGWRLRWYTGRHHLRRCTRWWRPRTVVARMDLATGTLTVATERWSWRRWRWERSEQVKAAGWRPL